MEGADYTLEADKALNNNDAIGDQLLKDTGITPSSDSDRAALLALAGASFVRNDSVVGEDGMLLFPPLFMDAADESLTDQFESGEINDWSDLQDSQSGFSSNDDAADHEVEVEMHAQRRFLTELIRRFMARADFAYFRDRMRALEARGLSNPEIATAYHRLSGLLSAVEHSLLTAEQRTRLALQALENVEYIL